MTSYSPDDLSPAQRARVDRWAGDIISAGMDMLDELLATEQPDEPRESAAIPAAPHTS